MAKEFLHVIVDWLQAQIITVLYVGLDGRSYDGEYHEDKKQGFGIF